MSFNDDKDDPASSSSSEYFGRSDKGKTEKKERDARSKGKLLDLRRAVLRSEIKPVKDDRKQEKAEKKEKKNRDNEAKEKEDHSFGTKTLLQIQKASIQTAQQIENTDTAVAKEKRQADMKKQAEEEFQQDLP